MIAPWLRKPRIQTVHGWLPDLLPESRGAVLDVGAGTGRDAAAFAALGHEVVAVEPSSSMLREALLRQANPGIRWLAGARSAEQSIRSGISAATSILPATDQWPPTELQSRGRPDLSPLAARLPARLHG